MNQLQKNQINSFRILNYLHAQLQGEFVARNIEAQFGLLKDYDLKKLQAEITRVTNWLDLLWDGEALFQEEKGRNQSEDAKVAIEMLTERIPLLNEMADKLAAVLYTDRGSDLGLPTRVALLAAYGQRAYALEHYAKGFLRFAEVYSDKELAKIWTENLQRTEEAVHITHNLLEDFALDRSEQIELLDKEIRLVARTLPGAYRSITHDIRQIQNVFQEDFSFEHIACTRAEALQWKQNEVTPLEAGYWKAYGYSPERAQFWRQVGFFDVQVAAEWETLGFPPEIAVGWSSVNFPPLLAHAWGIAGFDPPTALLLVKEGYPLPEDLPKEGLEELVHQVAIKAERSFQDTDGTQRSQEETTPKATSQSTEEKSDAEELSDAA